MKQKLRLGDCYALTKHKPRYLKIRYFSLVAVLTTMCLYVRAQRPDSSGPVPPGVDTTAVTRDTIAIEEVEIINTGYQRIPKERATGSFEYLSSEDLQIRPGVNLLDRLEGTSSILFDRRSSGSPILQIRGMYSMDEALAQPLIVLDNFPFEGNIQAINPLDIASITILKDAAAASIWGARAGNGVIIITTKSGRYNSPLRVSANSTLSITTKPDLQRIPMLPASDYIDLERYLFEQGAYDALINNQTAMPALTPVVSILNKYREGSLDEQRANQKLDRLRANDIRDDFSRYLYRHALMGQYQAEIYGGGQQSAYRLSTGYDGIHENLVGNKLGRYTFNVNHRYTPHRSVELSTSIRYTETDKRENSLGGFGHSNYRFSNGLVQGVEMPIYMPLADEYGNALPMNLYRQEWLDTVGNGALLDWSFKPLDELNHRNYRFEQRNLVMDAQLTANLSPWLTLMGSYRYQLTSSKQHNEQTASAYRSRDLINSFTNLHAANASGVYPVPRGGILDLNHLTTNSHNFRVQANIDHQLISEGDLSVMIGAEARQIATDGSNHRTYGYDDRLNTSSVDFVTTYPRLVGYATLIPNSAGHSQRTDRFVSAYGNAAFVYKQRYTISASGRNDATNLFGVTTRNRWKPLYSVGLSWDISKENFYHLEDMPEFKIRLTHGYQGNINNSVSAYTQILYLPAALNGPVNMPFAMLVSGENPNLRWETVRQLNAAVDFASKNRRISGSVDVYLKRSDDVLSNEDSDPTTGFSLLYRNSASLRGKGIEIQLNGLNVKTTNFVWQSRLLFNYSTYKVAKYKYKSNRRTYVSSGDIITPMEGYHPYAVISYPWAGLDPQNGDPLGYLSGNVSSNWDSITRYTPLNQLVLHGPALPASYGNLLNTVSYKQFSLSVNVTFKLGYFVRERALNYYDLVNGGIAHVSYRNRWQQPGDEQYTNVPSMRYPVPNRNRDSFYEDAAINVQRGDHARLEQIKLTASLLGNKLQLFTYLDQLNVILWKATPKNIDPEYPAGLKPGTTYSLGFRLTL